MKISLPEKKVNGFQPKKKIFSIHKFYLLFRVFFIMFLIFEKYNLLRQDLTNNRRGLGIKPILE
jgi:hypothetical protein